LKAFLLKKQTMGRFKEILVGAIDAHYELAAILPTPVRRGLDLAIGRLADSLMTEPEHFIHEYNRATGVLGLAESLLEGGNGTTQERGQWMREAEEAKKRLVLIRERYPKIDQLVKEHDTAMERARGEISQELGRV